MKNYRQLEDVQCQLTLVFGDVVSIVPSTYAGVAQKATFVDTEFGEWTARVHNVLAGHGHPARGRRNSRQTCLKRYGSETPLGSSVVRAKIKETCLERYGSENPLGSEEIREQVRLTMQERYGVDNAQQDPEIRARTLQRHFDRYGVEFPLQCPSTLLRALETHEHRFGVTNPMQVAETRTRAQETCLRRYGHRNPAQVPEIYRRSLISKKHITEIDHWRTSESLQCQGSYEVAVVQWLNTNRIDFDWQVSFQVPVTEDVSESIRGRTYYVDMCLKDWNDELETYVEIKGHWMQAVSKDKWEWFKSCHSTAELWTGDVLKRMGILGKKRIKNRNDNERQSIERAE